MIPENDEELITDYEDKTVYPDYQQLASIIVRWQNQILMLHRITEPFANYWSIPGGGVKQSESYKEAAMRELREETGIDTYALTPLAVYLDHQNKLESHVFEFISADGKFNNTEPNEHDLVLWKSLNEVTGLKLTPGVHLIVTAFA